MQGETEDTVVDRSNPLAIDERKRGLSGKLHNSFGLLVFGS